MTQNDQPIKEFRVSGIIAAIWKRQVDRNGKTVTRHSVRIQKQYRHESGEWKETNYFFPEDLPKLQLVTAKAFEFISLKESEADSEYPTVAR